MKDEPLNKFRKPNTCPYCGHYCDAATIIDDDKRIPPTVGSLSFCINCAESSEFDKNMILIKFNLDSIENEVERNRLKNLQQHMKNFLKINPRQ